VSVQQHQYEGFPGSFRPAAFERKHRVERVFFQAIDFPGRDACRFPRQVVPMLSFWNRALQVAVCHFNFSGA
jgi:hypothetical protein